MEFEVEQKKLLKKNYTALKELGIPTEILDNLKNWIFFLQEGWNREIHWNYKEYLTNYQIIHLYWFIKNNNIESELAKNIEVSFKLKDKVQFQIKEIQPYKFDFYIHQKQLSKMILIDRFNMMYSGFDLDIVEKNQTQYKINKNAIDIFLGDKSPVNQFRTPRQVLYRCHCGSDYCGCVSTEILISKDIVTWKNIGFEDDEGVSLENNERNIKGIQELKFSRIEYENEFKKYKNKYGI